MVALHHTGAAGSRFSLRDVGHTGMSTGPLPRPPQRATTGGASMASHAMLTALPPRPSLLAHCASHLRKRLVPMAAPFEGAINMQSISLQEAEQLYLKLPERSNDKHVMLVMYAPWCSHCKAMETQVRLLSEGLAPESQQLSIKVLDCSDSETSAFAKEVLGVPSLPAFCIFPQHSRTFYKFKGKTRDAQSLLKFINMVCNQNSEKVWELRGTQLVAAEAAAATASTSNRPHVTTSVAASPAGNAALPASALTAAGIAASVCLVAGIAYLARGQQSGCSADGDGEASSSAGVLSPTTTATDAPPGSEPRSKPELLAAITTSMSNLAKLWLRLVRAWIGLSIASGDEPAAGGVDAKPAAVDVEAKVVATQAPNGNGMDATALPPAAHPAASGAGGMRRSGTTVAAAVAVPVATAAMDVPAPASVPWPLAALPAVPSMQAVDAATAVSSLLPGQALEAGLTREVVIVSGVSADQVLALLAEGDVQRTLNRLMQQQEVQVQVQTVAQPAVPSATDA